MSITISKLMPGHVVTTVTTRTTVNARGSFSNTTSSDSFQYGPNKWGQVGVQVKFYNESSKEIKYIDFEFFPRNNVNDIVRDRVSGNSYVNLRVTGPIKPHSVNVKQWNYVWDGRSISSVSIRQIKIFYMDGTEETQTAPQINYDGGMSCSYALPITVAAILAAAIPCCFAWSQYVRLPISIIPYALIVCAAFLALYFSRTKLNAKLSSIFSISGLAISIIPICEALSLFSIDPVHSYSFYYSRRISSLLLPSFVVAITIFIMLALAVLCRMNIIKPFRKKSKALVSGFWITTTAIFVDFCFLYAKGYGYIADWFQLGLGIILNAYIWITAISCRNVYNIPESGIK